MTPLDPSAADSDPAVSRALDEAPVLVLAIVQDEDAAAAVHALVEQQFAVTRLATAGGFLRASNATIFTVTKRARLPQVLAVFQRTCRQRTKWFMPFMEDPALTGYVGEPIEVEVGGAVVFVLPVERVVRLQAGAATRPGSAATPPHRDEVELYLQSSRLVGREAELLAVVRQLPGVEAVQGLGFDRTALEARVLVTFDPGRINPVVLEDALTRAGFTVLSAGERRPR